MIKKKIRESDIKSVISEIKSDFNWYEGELLKEDDVFKDLNIYPK